MFVLIKVIDADIPIILRDINVFEGVDNQQIRKVGIIPKVTISAIESKDEETVHLKKY